MLNHIQIRDFAIIDAVELELSGGLTVLTGETGAGKSILVDALLLAAGGRAGAEVVRHGAERAEVSATFSLTNNAAALGWLSEQSIEHEGECVLRRVVSSDGRSRAYVNGQSMPVQALRQLGEALVDVHGQMEYQSLMRRGPQRELLDRHGANDALLQTVGRHWKTLAALREEHERATSSAQEREARLELLRYHLGELEALDLKAGEIEELTAERLKLSQRGKLASGARGIAELLRDGEEFTAEQALSKALTVARTLQELDADFAPMVRAIDESLIAMREAVEAVSRYESNLDADAGRQEWVEQRLAAVEAIARKHRVEPTALFDTHRALEEEFAALNALAVSAGNIEARLQEADTIYRGASNLLSKSRRSAAAQLSESVTTLMQRLGMPGGKFQADVRGLAADAVGPHGADEVEFLVSANPGQPLRPLAKVASGGELSRISLAVQVAAAQTDALPCLVFDEVDAGVGGGVAEIVGRQLRTLGDRAQVLCVTHLPQVASQAHAHVRVAKLTDGKTTRTSLHTLTADERVEEIARMLGGVSITDKAREHAAEMLRVGAETPKKKAKRK
ncbi:MAG: DNA repair protein RecN [Steroidobacteraceae bacterium]